jgi:cytidylate kinase
MIVAIDGPAGSGKSTVARTLAKRDGFVYLDTGAMYRAVTLLCLDQGVDISDAQAVAKVAQTACIEFKAGDASTDGKPYVFIDGRDVTTDIRTSRVDENVSAVSAIPAVREAMVTLQRTMAKGKNVVAEGRDIGTVVFPNADVKVFLSADVEARAHRRTLERMGKDPIKDRDAKPDHELYEKILADMKARDAYDESREASPLKPAEDAIHIDSTKTDAEGVVAEINALIKKAETKDIKKREAAETPKADKMHAFRGNTADDYFDHAMRDFPVPARLLFSAIVGVGNAITKIMWPCTWDGLDEFCENLRAQLAEDGKGCVIIQNHTSMIEPVVTVVTLKRRGFDVRAVFKQEFMKNKVFTWAFTRIGGIPVARGEADLTAVQRSVDALNRGECLLIYPEGTRIKDDEPHEIHGGFALIANLAKTDIVPMAVVGARDAKPKGAKHTSRKPIWMSVGSFLKFEDLDVKGRKKRVAKMEEIGMQKVFELRDKLRAEHPGEM